MLCLDSISEESRNHFSVSDGFLYHAVCFDTISIDPNRLQNAMENHLGFEARPISAAHGESKVRLF